MMIAKNHTLLYFIALTSTYALSSHLTSLSQISANPTQSSLSYLDSLCTTSNKGDILEERRDEIQDLTKIRSKTPAEHYAKKHPGAGWAGFQHPQFGGYLNNLGENAWEEGKEKDYGDDIRWGAEVYLDNL